MSELRKDAVFEAFDETEYQYSVIMGADDDLPSKHEISDGIIQDQGEKRKTSYYCVAYSTSSGSNAMNILEGSGVYISGEDLGDIMVDRGLMDPKRGAFIKDGPATAKDLNYLASYFYIKTLDEIKHAIASNRPVVVGSNTIDWKKTRENANIAVKGKSYGHAMLICGYDDDTELLKVENSYGDDKYDNGYIYVKYDEVDEILFRSKIALIDEINIAMDYRENILKKIDHEPAQKAFLIGIWNGLDATEPASRQEVATMIWNAMEKIK